MADGIDPPPVDLVRDRTMTDTPMSGAGILRDLAGWWWTQAIRHLPARWRGPTPVALWITPDGAGYRVKGPGFAQQLDVGAAPPTVPAGAVPVLALPDARVLERRFTAPAAAAGSLDAIVALELDRRTPFRADQVLFAARTEPAGEGRVTVVVTVLPRAGIADHLDRLSRVGLAPQAVAVEGMAADSGYRLLPMPGRQDVDRAATDLARRIGVVAAVLAGIVGIAWVEMAWRTSRLTEQAANRAAAVAAIRTEAEAIDQQRRALDRPVAMKRETASALVVLEVMSRTIPTGTWITDYRFENGSIALSGVTDDADGLLARLQASPHLTAAAWRSALVREADGKDRFEIVATLVPHDAP